MTIIQHRDTGDESEAAMTDELAVSRSSFFGREFVPSSDYDALRAENERLKAENASLKEANEIDLREKAPLIFENTALSARVSELTRLLAEAESGLRYAYVRLPARAAFSARPEVQRALQSGEGGK